jgi:hypothetical protein
MKKLVKKAEQKAAPTLKKLPPKKLEVPAAPAPKYTDLRQVMDYKRPFTVFYSGVEYEQYLDIIYELGVRNFLMSYEYAKGKGSGKLKKYHDMHLFIDSGAFTYQVDPKYKDWTPEQWEGQIKEYLNWARKHKDSIFAIADLDLQYLPNVGYKTVYEWRKKYFEPFMLETGIPVCFIYHEDGMDVWEYMCQRYPYVGLSLSLDKVDSSGTMLHDMFQIAKKYGAVCQGMASTRAGMLLEYPFYTVDSTTWKAGLRYGKTVVFDGKSMHEYDKDQLVTKGQAIFDRYKVKFDIQKILDNDVEEVCRASAYAFMMMEEYIQERTKHNAYWMKEKTIAVDVNNLPEDFFPPVDWFVDPLHAGMKDYAKKMNINPEYDGAYGLVYDMTIFMNWGNGEYEALEGEYLANDGKVISDLHDLFVNRIVPTQEEKLKDLIEFYRDCLSGKNEKLLQIGTNFDRVVKERESYLEEEDKELVDLSPEEMKVKLYNLLPAPDGEKGDMPEIEELDEEIARAANIIPVFGPDGKFIKGQVYRPAQREVYSKKYPKFACDTCRVGTKCAEYKAGYVCAYNKLFKRFNFRNMADIYEVMIGMAEHNSVRMQKAMIEETVSGIFDPNVTSFIDQNMRLLQTMKALQEQSSAEVLRQTRVVRADGSREETVQVTNPQEGGLLEKLLKSRMGKAPVEDEDEDKPPKTKKSVYASIPGEMDE